MTSVAPGQCRPRHGRPASASIGARIEAIPSAMRGPAQRLQHVVAPRPPAAAGRAPRRRRSAVSSGPIARSAACRRDRGGRRGGRAGLPASLVLVHALVERHDAEPRRAGCGASPSRSSLTIAGVEHGGQPRRRARRQPLRHRQPAPRRHRLRPGCPRSSDRTARPQRRRQIEPAEQAAVRRRAAASGACGARAAAARAAAASQRSRTGPARRSQRRRRRARRIDRERAPPPAAASAQTARLGRALGQGAEQLGHGPRRRARSSRPRRAGCGAAGGAAPTERIRRRLRVAAPRHAVEGRQRAGGADQRQLAAQAVRAEADAQPRRPLDRGVRHRRPPGSRSRAATICGATGARPASSAATKPAGSRSKASRRRTTSIRVGRSSGVFTSTERPKRSSSCGRNSPSSGIAAADQDEACGMADAQALALDHVLARRRDVQQQVDQMVLQQVDLVDVEEAPVGAGQQPGLERLLTLGQRPLEVERADDAVLGGAQRQIDHRHRRRDALDRRTARCARQSGHSGRIGRRIAVVAAARHDLHRRQQGRQRPDRGRFAGAPVAEHQHAADRVDRRPRSAAPASSLPGRRWPKMETGCACSRYGAPRASRSSSHSPSRPRHVAPACLPPVIRAQCSAQYFRNHTLKRAGVAARSDFNASGVIQS